MATIATALIEFADSGDSRTYTLPSHTVLDSKTLTQRRKVPSGKQTVAESSLTFSYAVRDTVGNALPQRLSTTVISRLPILMNASSGLSTTMLAHVRDVVNSDEFAAMLSSQSWVKA